MMIEMSAYAVGLIHVAFTKILNEIALIFEEVIEVLQLCIPH